MSKITIIPSDSIVGIDGVFEVVLYTDDPTVHAVQWDEFTEAGVIEYKDKANLAIGVDGFMAFEHYIADYATATQAREDAAEAAGQAQQDALTQRQRRWREYPSITEQLEALYAERQGDGGAALAIVDAAIAAVDLLYPL